MNIQDIADKYSEDTDGVVQWCKEEYSENFAPYFKDVDELYQQLSKKGDKISDKELEHVLVDVPLSLFEVAEIANSYKAKIEVLKLRMKEVRREAVDNSESTTQAGKKEDGELATVDLEILIKAYQAVVDRVDREMQYSRELIMSCKKIWTARKEAQSGMRMVEPPINNYSSIPDYQVLPPDYVG